MFKERKFVKKVLAMFMIVAMLLPYTTEVLAVALKQTDTSTQLETLPRHQGGSYGDNGEKEDYLEFVDSNLRSNYDSDGHVYRIANSESPEDNNNLTTVFKIRKKDDNNFEDALFCLNAEKSFPSEDSTAYTNKGSLKDLSKTDVSNFKSDIGEANYNALLWLFDNMYLRNCHPELYKEEFLNTVFAATIEAHRTDVVPLTTGYIASILTEDDIEVVEQWAIWYFTNRSDPEAGYKSDYQTYCKAKYNALRTIKVSDTIQDTPKTFKELYTNQQMGEARQEFANILFDYLVSNAKNHTTSETVTYPSFAMEDETLSCTSIEGYYKIGPFRVNGGTGTAEFSVVDQNDNEINANQYKILIGDETTFTNRTIDQIFDTDYYICIPKEGNTITKVSVKMNYTTFETKASLWKASDSTRQPVVLITREDTPHPSRRGTTINEDQPEEIFDLALRKYIVSVGGAAVSTRTPATPTRVTDNGTAYSAEYKHIKEPYTVEPNTKVVFEIAVYNEGELDGTAKEITDYLPEGMTMVPKANSSINRENGWEISDDGRVATTTKLSGETIAAFKNRTELDKKTVRIECQIDEHIAENISSAKVLTNIAEITDYSTADGDSNPRTITEADRNNVDFRGSTPEDESLNIPNHYYPGIEDDDDFEKIKINPIQPEKQLDLALRKYIVKVGDKTVTNRTPATPTEVANNGTAVYKHRKDPYELTPGTKVTYEITVYNEGELDGTATAITDYLPEGMIMVPTEDSQINRENGWVAAEDGRSATTTILADKTIAAFKNRTELDKKSVRIECLVSADAAANNVDDKVLTNVAEITGYSSTDRDSSPTIDPTTINYATWSGDRTNPEDLSNPETFYKGIEDDDDFEKVVIKIKSFDLALKKFITKINGKALTTSREPQVDTTKLKAGTSKDATYTTTKTPVEVKKGDIVTYKIRVYNEGETAGYAEEVTDFIPAGLGYLVNYKDNVSNKWTIPQGATNKKLSEIESGTTNLKAEDFEGNTALNDQIVVIGGGKFTSTKLASTVESNLIPAFDGTQPLAYKDVEITCIVLSDETADNNLRNIAEIAKNSDENKVEVIDRDSIPNTVNPDTYPDGEKQVNDGKPQDDHDYENLVTPSTRYFDLALQKFITKLNNDEVANRAPTITKNSDGTFRYSHPTEALPVANNDEITYTIRVYNEGDIDGYAKEVMDDIPKGLEFLPDHATNKEFEWKMYDKDGKETTDVKQAASVKTTYLSKEKEANGRQNLIKAYNAATMQAPDYKDVKLVFKVAETALADKTKRDIINTAEITANQDPNGKNIDDRDSIPGNKKPGEDDIDQEKVNVKYFDLSLKKTIAKIVITENGKTREIVPKSDKDLLKVEINRKYLATTTVKVIYNITITNEGQIAGYAKEVKDYIPKGLVFNEKDNPNWSKVSTDCVRTEALANTLIEPGKNATVQITLEWDKNADNLGEKINVAEISKDYNDHGSPDIDSTPDNQKAGEDDIDNAPVILSISTGEEPVYVVLSTTVMLILAVGIALIKKYVLV